MTGLYRTCLIFINRRILQCQKLHNVLIECNHVVKINIIRYVENKNTAIKADKQIRARIKWILIRDRDVSANKIAFIESGKE